MEDEDIYQNIIQKAEAIYKQSPDFIIEEESYEEEKVPQNLQRRMTKQEMDEDQLETSLLRNPQ